MGSSQSQITESQFSKNWRETLTADHFTIWQHRGNPALQLEQYYAQDNDDEATRRLLTIRNHNPCIVGAFLLRADAAGCCSDRQGTKLLVERIPLRLSNLEDIPFPDILHLFDACLRGFGELANEVGFFRVDEEQVGVNERGQVKVWLNTAFESMQVVGTRSVPQHQMIQDIIALVIQAEDPESFPSNIPSISRIFSSVDRSTTFQSLTEGLKDYATKYTSSYIPSSLQCVHSVGGAQLINEWCRNNLGQGFQQSSLRVGQKAQQYLPPPSVPQEDQKDYNRVIDNQLATALQAQVATQPQQQSLQQPLLSITSQVQQQQQLQNTQLRQLHHRAIQHQPPSSSHVIRPPYQQQNIVQSSSQVATQQEQSLVRNLDELQQQRRVHFAEETVQLQPRIVQQQPAPQQSFITYAGQQVGTQIVGFPVPPQQNIQQTSIYVPQMVISQQKNKPRIRPPQRQQQPQQEEVIISNDPNQAREAPISNPSIIYLQKQPSQKQLISEVFPQNDSRLQQQRVISQTIEIKDSSRGIETNLNPSQTYIPSNKTEDRQSSQIQTSLHSYARAVPFSTNVAEDRFASSEDGKSSAEFLALLSQLKSGSGKELQVYSQVAETPSYLKAASSQEGSPKQYFNYLPQQEPSYQRESSPKANNNSNSNNSPQYGSFKYEFKMDADLQADLLRYRE